MHGRTRRQTRYDTLLTAVVCLFWLWHLFALPRAVETQKAGIKFLKLTLTSLSIWTVAHLFPGDLHFEKNSDV